jgi:hypothetical protein
MQIADTLINDAWFPVFFFLKKKKKTTDREPGNASIARTKPVGRRRKPKSEPYAKPEA